MIRHLSFGLIKFLMMSVPFFSMVMMILALWGVVGKTTYTDGLDTTKKGIAFGTQDAKNYLVNERKIIEQCPEKSKSPDIEPERKNLKPGKIDWEHIA